MAVPYASMKVYEPIGSFPADERAQLLESASVAAGPASILLSRSRGLGEPLEERADVIEQDDKIYLCPYRSRLRFLTSLLAFHNSIPGGAVGAFMPLDQVTRAASELALMRARHPSWKSHILTSAWSVPVRWFVAFDEPERDCDPAVPMLRYRTSMGAARARTQRAVRAARDLIPDDEVAALVSELALWLERFSPESVVELDYGELALLHDSADLAEDRSAADVQEAVRALSVGELVDATTAYMKAAERWAPLSALDRNN